MRMYNDVVTLLQYDCIPPSPAPVLIKERKIIGHIWIENSVEAMANGGETTLTRGKLYARPHPLLRAKNSLRYKSQVYDILGDPVKTGKGDEVAVLVQGQVNP